MRGVFAVLSTVPRPTDDPRVHASGVDSDRLLLFGSGAAVGWGVLSHDMALPGAFARALAHLTGRGVDVDVMTEPEWRLANAVRLLGPVDLTRYDGIILTLGLNESVSLASASAWRRDLGALFDYLTVEAPGTPVFLVGIHAMTEITRYDRLVAPFVAHNRRALNRVSSALSAHRASVTFVPFDPPPRTDRNRYRSRNEYRDGGMLLAARVAPVLDAVLDNAGIGRRPRQRALDTLARRNALDEFAILDATRDDAFDRLTEFARVTLHAAAANITIVGSERFWTTASRGAPPTEGPGYDSICFTTIEHEDALVVADASRDPRFADMRRIEGPPAVKFYAGYRIEAPNGVPIGVLCVHDVVEHDLDQFDRALLRDIALLAQKEIWLGAQKRSPGGYTIRRVPPAIGAPVERTFAPTPASSPTRTRTPSRS